MNKSIVAKAFYTLFVLCLVLISTVSCSKEGTNDAFSFVYLFPDELAEWELVQSGAEEAINDFVQQNKQISVDVDFFTADCATVLCNNLTNTSVTAANGICIAMPYFPKSYAEESAVAAEKQKSDYRSLFYISNLIKEITNNGVPVITIGNDQYLCSNDLNDPYSWGEYMEPPSRSCFVGSDNIAFGRRIAEKAIDMQGGAAQIYYNWGWLRSTEQINRCIGLNDVVSEKIGDGTKIICSCGGLSSHPYPIDEHGVYFTGIQTVYYPDDGDTEPRTEEYDMNCFCDILFEDDMRVNGNEINSFISLWRGGNFISDYFREKGLGDTASNIDHLVLLSEDSPYVLKAVKEKYATLTLIEDRYEWGYQSAKLLLEYAVKNKMPESDSVYTPVYWVDYESVWDY